MSQSFVLDGQLRLQNVIRFLQSLPLMNNGRVKRWKITVSEYRAERSDAQNHALWGVAYPPLMAHAGLSGEKEKEELHELMCGEYWGWNKKTILGRTKARPKRTTTKDEAGKRCVLSKMEFCDFYAFVQRKGAEYGCFVPDPDPEWFMTEQKAA